MKNNFLKITTVLFIVLLKINAFAQFGQMPPFSISLEAITGTNISGMHSFAFAQSGDKWLIVGGRTNGLHGVNSNDGFPAEFKNDKVIVIDTTTWQEYSADLNQLPFAIADPMRSTNMQYIQDSSYLYMVGGFGWDSVASMYVTFPKLTAIHVDDMISAVIAAQPIGPHIRQLTDTAFQTCGGELGKVGNDYYLMFGHNFGGRYTDPPTPLFTQQYRERITKFNINDDGTTVSAINFSNEFDTINFHRRDLNAGNIIKPDGSFALKAYGGVFKKTANLPFREPIQIESSGTTVNSYQQVMSHYTCANMPIFDSLSNNMYSTFFGGISLYDYNPGLNTVSLDTMVPFISDITTMNMYANGTIDETVMPVQLPALLGSNSKFVLNQNIAHFDNEVIDIRQLPNTKILAGYMYGGIRAQQGNFGTSISNDTIYRIYLTPNNQPVGIEELNSVQNALLYPNPSYESSTLFFSLKDNENVRVSIQDLNGKEMLSISNSYMQKGNQQLSINTSKLSAGMYICRIKTGKYEKALKMIVNK